MDVALDAAGKDTPMRMETLFACCRFRRASTRRLRCAAMWRIREGLRGIPGMKLSELLPNSQSLVTRDYWQKRNQLGLPSPVFQPDYAQRFTAYRQTQAENQRQYLLSCSGTRRKRYPTSRRRRTQTGQGGDGRIPGATTGMSQASPQDTQGTNSNNMANGSIPAI